MDRKTTTHKKPRMMRALAAFAVVLSAGLIGSAPARADHGPDVHFGFSFGFPAPVIPIPVPVPVVRERVYYQPPVVYRPAPVVYYAPPVHYYEPAYPHRDWRKHDRARHRQPWGHDRWDHRDARW